MLRYKRNNIQFFTETFFVPASGVSTSGNNCAQIFLSNKWFVAIYPIQSKGKFPDALHMLCKEAGVSLSITTDPYGEKTSRKFKKFFTKSVQPYVF